MILHQITTDKVIPLLRFGQGVTPHMVVSGHTIALSSVTLSLGATPCRSCCRCLPHALFRKIMAAYRWLACSIGSLIELGKLGVTLSGDQCDTYDFSRQFTIRQAPVGVDFSGKELYIPACSSLARLAIEPPTPSTSICLFRSKLHATTSQNNKTTTATRKQWLPYSD